MNYLKQSGSFIFSDDPERVFPDVFAAAKYMMEQMSPQLLTDALQFWTELHTFTLQDLAEIHRTGALQTPPWERPRS